MATKYLDSNGLLYFWQKIKGTFLTDVTYNSSSKKIQKTKNGTTSDVVTLAAVATTGAYSDISGTPTLATVATSGDYDDLTDKPTIPTVTDTYSGTSSDGMSGKAVKSAIDALDGTVSGSAGSGKTLTAFSQTDGKVSATFGNISITKSQVSDFPTLGDAAAKGVVSTISADSTDLPTVTAVKSYVSTAITGAAAFQGTAPTTFAPTNYKKGWYWVVGTAGTYAGQTCEAGDMIFAIADYASAYSASDFDVIQTNLDITSISNAEIDTIVAS